MMLPPVKLRILKCDRLYRLRVITYPWNMMSSSLYVIVQVLPSTIPLWLHVTSAIPLMATCNKCNPPMATCNKRNPPMATCNTRSMHSESSSAFTAKSSAQCTYVQSENYTSEQQNLFE